jgi:hypothetical protein
MSREDSSEGTHSHRFRKVNSEVQKVRFSPDVVKRFRHLEAFVHDSEHFAPQILENLQDHASGKPAHLATAMADMAAIAQQTMKHVYATGDLRAESALDELFDSFLNRDKTPPVTVLAMQRSRAASK